MNNDETYEMMFTYTRTYRYLTNAIVFLAILDAIIMLFVIPVWVFWQLQDFSVIVKVLLMFPLMLLEYVWFYSISVCLLVIVGYTILKVLQKLYLAKMRRNMK